MKTIVEFLVNNHVNNTPHDINWLINNVEHTKSLMSTSDFDNLKKKHEFEIIDHWDLYDLDQEERNFYNEGVTRHGMQEDFIVFNVDKLLQLYDMNTIWDMICRIWSKAYGEEIK